MRSIIIGIVIGVVFGVMAGTTFVAPRLDEARTDTAGTDASTTVPDDAESLDLPSNAPPKIQISEPVSRLRIVSLYPAKTPILGELPLRIKRAIPAASGGRIAVSVYDPGALVDADDTLDAVRSGAVDAVFAAPGYWDEADAALQLLTSVPFGPGAEEHLAWFYHGGGQALLRRNMKAKGVHALLCGAIPPEASGWYRHPVRDADGFAGLKIRAFGLGGDVLKKMGADVVQLSPGEILAQFELGELDGAEYSLPSVDNAFAFQKFARNYYFPGWHQPLTLLTLAINAKTWAALSESDRHAVATACGDNVRYALALGDAQQFEALKQISLAGVQIRRWPDEILTAFHDTWKEIAREHAQNNKAFSETWDSLQRFRRDYAIWYEISRIE